MIGYNCDICHNWFMGDPVVLKNLENEWSNAIAEIDSTVNINLLTGTTVCFPCRCDLLIKYHQEGAEELSQSKADWLAKKD